MRFLDHRHPQCTGVWCDKGEVVECSKCGIRWRKHAHTLQRAGYENELGWAMCEAADVASLELALGSFPPMVKGRG